MRRATLAVFFTVLAGLAAAAQAPPKLKVYISADMEGIGGVVTRLQLAPGEPEYERFREFMTAEVNAAIVACPPINLWTFSARKFPPRGLIRIAYTASASRWANFSARSGMFP